ncbi:DUF5663 domain-containing protein [Amycolatopsis sp. NPDC049252]|uniref:DUF5663 domain-containing protein n=1 Tax=Amycolatopsis sp. NPDC049252 TaxID=3363933 RepID=UPI00370FBBF9
MITLDDSLLLELGLGDLPAEVRKLVLATIYEQIELRVGYRLAGQMSSGQLDEFEGFIDRNDEAGALEWLQENAPGYPVVVQETFDNLKQEILDNRIDVRAVLVQAAPKSLVNFLTRVQDTPDERLACDIFVYVGGVDALCGASEDLLGAVPGMTESLVAKIVEGCRDEMDVRGVQTPKGLSAAVSNRLLSAFGDWDGVRRATDVDILGIVGVGPATLRKIRGAKW